MRYPTLVLTGVVVALGCADLPAIEADRTCGNGVLEPENNEDCEPGKHLPGGLICGEAGDELACRLVCADDDGEGPRIAPCPDGWGCALGGFCQPPSGQFAAPRVVPGITTPLGIGDFDGDRYPDLATVQEPLLSVAYGNALTAYQVSLVVPIDAAPHDPVVASVDGDETDDLIVNAGERLSIYKGASDQTMAPLMVPSQVYPELPDQIRLVAAPIGDNLGREVPLMIVRDDSSLLVYLADSDYRDQAPIELPSPGANLPYEVATGDFVRTPDDPDHGIVELAVAAHRSETIVLVSLYCDTDDVEAQAGDLFEPECEIWESGEVRAPRGWQLGDGGTFAAYLDEDDVLDLVFALQGPAGQGVGAAMGLEGGGFGPATVLPIEYTRPGADTQMAPGAQLPSPPPFLLAVARLDGPDDTLADIVTGDGVFSAERVGANAEISYRETFGLIRRWDEVEISDLNRDGLPDIIGIAGPSVLIHLNVDGRLFNTAESTIDAVELALRIGDFDGDLFPDLLVAVDSRLLIGFNNGRGLIEGFREALSVAGSLETTVLRLINNTDATDDIALIVRETGLPPYLLELEGSGTRRLAAPLKLPTAIAATLITEDPDGVARAIMGERGEGRFRFRSLDRSAVLTALFEEPPFLDTEGDCDFSVNADLLSTSFDDGQGDAYLPLAVVETTSESLPISAGGPWIPRRVSYGSDAVMRCTALAASPLTSAPELIRVADINGDRAPDLLLAHPAERTPDDEVSTVGGLAIYWGDGRGGFDAEPEALMLVAPDIDPENQQSEFRGVFGTIETNGRMGDELLVMFGAGLHLVTYDDGGFDTPVRLPGNRISSAEVSRIDPIDLDADGVTDVVLSGPRQTLLLLQDPCTPLEAEEDECTRDIVVRGGDR